jgi:hypothetical protein
MQDTLLHNRKTGEGERERERELNITFHTLVIPVTNATGGSSASSQ